MTYYKIEPVDTLFFRDGRPYNMEEKQMNVESIFPPSPYTVAGAIRASLALNIGWDGKGDWDNNIKAKLGDGNNLGPLKFSGPYITKGDEILFSVPRCLMGRKVSNKDNKWENFARLKPGTGIKSDAGKIRFPMLEGNPEKMKNINGYVTFEDMKKLLWNDNIEDIKIIPNDDIWKKEPNVGIKRKESSLNVEEGNLFSRSFVRLGRKINIVSGVTGIDEELKGTLMLGGEAKAAYISKAGDVKLPEVKVNKLKKFSAVFITPGKIENLKPGESVEGLPEEAKLVSACVDRPQMIGGWDFNKGPMPLKPYLRTGTTLFFESDTEIDITKYNGKKIGKNTEFGFGQILIGKW